MRRRKEGNMSEWNEQKIDEELMALLQDMADQDKLEKRIDQSINKRIRKTVIRTLTVAVVALLIIFLLINPMMNHAFINPYMMNSGENKSVFKRLRTYCEMVYPYREVMSLDVKKKGFGRYELKMQVADLTEPFGSSDANVWYDINFSSPENIVDAESVLTANVNRFRHSEFDKAEMIEKISELPKSAVIYLSVSEPEARNINEIRNLEVELQWFQVYQPEVEFQGGINYQPRGTYDEGDRRQMTEQELLELYRENIKQIRWRTELWSAFGLGDGSKDTSYGFLEERLRKTWISADALTELKSENYCVYGKRDEVISFLQGREFDSIFIDNVNLW